MNGVFLSLVRQVSCLGRRSQPTCPRLVPAAPRSRGEGPHPHRLLPESVGDADERPARVPQEPRARVHRPRGARRLGELQLPVIRTRLPPLLHIHHPRRRASVPCAHEKRPRPLSKPPLVRLFGLSQALALSSLFSDPVPLFTATGRPRSLQRLGARGPPAIAPAPSPPPAPSFTLPPPFPFPLASPIRLPRPHPEPPPQAGPLPEPDAVHRLARHGVVLGGARDAAHAGGADARRARAHVALPRAVRVRRVQAHGGQLPELRKVRGDAVLARVQGARQGARLSRTAGRRRRRRVTRN